MQLRKFSLGKFLWILTILINQSVIAYEPKSLMNGSSKKYTTGTIDSGDFCYTYWMDTTMTSNYGSAAAVRESFAPSAMVDTNGDLYAISLWEFSSEEGPCFAIKKYVNGSFSNIITFYPWTKILGVTPKCQNTPTFDHGISVSEEDEKKFFKDYIHNAFMPCLAQEVGDSNSEYLYGFVYIPTTRLMNIQVNTSDYSGAENGGTEGMLFFKVKKDGLSNLTINYIPQTTCRNFQYNTLRPYDLSYPQPQFGNFKACYNTETQAVFLHDWKACYAFDTNGAITGTQEITNNGNIGCGIPTMRFQQLGNYFYHMDIRDGYLPKILMQSIKSSTPENVNKAGMNTFMYIEGPSRGNSLFLYPFDFLVLDGKSNNVLCILGFQRAKDYTEYTISALDDESVRKPRGWHETYCNFPCKNLSLLIWSHPITNDTTYTYFALRSNPEYVQNVIYTTSAEKSHLYTNTSSNIQEKIYLNTQKMCAYKNYIIYAYCYPGKSGKGNHLYIGYAPYAFCPDDPAYPDKNIRLRLLTKTEFKDQNDDSFITDCSRIISLDCKNGHVWLTYMAKNDVGNVKTENAYYKYFYIKASDLVGE